MTVIAWDGKTLASDKQCNIGGVAFTGTKIFRCYCGSEGPMLLGFAGTGARFYHMIEWFKKGADPDTYPPRPADDESVLIVIRKVDSRIDIRRYESSGYPLPIEDRVYADGGGREVALAAMHCGKSAEEAVALCAHLLPAYCGRGLDVLTFDSPESP